MNKVENAFSRQKISNYLRIVLLIVLLWGGSLFVIRSVMAIRYPYPLDFVEGLLLQQVKQLILGQTIYPTDFSAPLYFPAAYPPVFHLIVAPLYALVGPAYWYGRLLSWVAAMAVAYLIGRVIYLLTADRFASLMGGLFFVVLPYPLFWGSLFRVDLVALFFSWLALYFFVKREKVTDKSRRQKWATFVYPIVCSLIAAGIKHTYLVAVPITIAGYLFLKKDYTSLKSYLFWLIFTVALGGSLLVLFWGPGVWHNLIVINLKMSHYLPMLFGYWGEFTTLLPYVLVCHLLFLIFFESQNKAFWLAGLYLVGSLIVAMSVTKEGANSNYFLELSAAMCLVIGVLAHALKNNSKVLILFWLLVIAQTVQNNIWTYYHRNFYKVNKTFQKDYHQLFLQSTNNARIMDVIKDSSQPVLADDLTVGLLPLLGKEIYIEPFAMKQMAKNGLWSDESLIAAITRHDFGYILINSYKDYDNPLVTIANGQELSDHNSNLWWTKSIYYAVSDHYQVYTQIGNTLVFIPRDE